MGAARTRQHMHEGVLMNKNELAAQVAEITGLSKAKAEDAVNAVLIGIGNALARGDDAKLVGFGTFSVTERAAREGRNPRTGEPAQIAASKAVKFKAGSALKAAL